MSDEDTAVLLDAERKFVESENKTECQTTRPQKIFSSIAVVISGIIFGFDVGITSNLTKPISSLLNLSCTEHFYIVHAWVGGAFFSTVFGGYLIDILGRRGTITISMILLLLSSLLTTTDLINIVHVLLISRFISGFAGPLSAIAQCIYISEIAEPQNRGFRITLHQFGMAIGGLLSCVTIFVDNGAETWRFIKQILGIFTCWVIYITFYWLPPSYHSTIRKKEKTEKKKSYKLEVLMETFGLALFLIEVQQLCGHYTVLYYAPRFYSLLGVCGSQAAKMALSIFSAIKLVAASVCLCVIDRIGRRVLLITTSTIMMTTLSLLALLSSIDDFEITTFLFYHGNCDHLTIPESTPFIASHHIETWRPENPDAPWALPKSPPPYPMLPTPLSLVSPHQNICSDPPAESPLSPSLRIIGLVTVLLYQIADGIGFGTVAWVVISEILPVSVRGRSLCIVATLHWMNIGVPNIFIQLGSTIGSSFLIYSFICLISIIIVYLYYPETKNKSLEQIEEDFCENPLLIRSRDNLQALPFFGKSKCFGRRVQTPEQSTIL